MPTKYIWKNKSAVKSTSRRNKHNFALMFFQFPISPKTLELPNWTPCGFLKNVSSKERVKPCFLRPNWAEFLFSIKYEKPTCAMHYFHLNYINNVQDILAQKLYNTNTHTIFTYFSDVNNKVQSQTTKSPWSVGYGWTPTQWN